MTVALALGGRVTPAGTSSPPPLRGGARCIRVRTQLLPWPGPLTGGLAAHHSHGGAPFFQFATLPAPLCARLPASAWSPCARQPSTECHATLPLPLPAISLVAAPGKEHPPSLHQEERTDLGPPLERRHQSPKRPKWCSSALLRVKGSRSRG